MQQLTEGVFFVTVRARSLDITIIWDVTFPQTLTQTVSVMYAASKIHM